MSQTFTLQAPAQHEERIRKSRFLARAVPVASESEALTFLQATAAADADANHHCWAWQIGPACRFSDAGEPGGSAGKPILMAIQGQAMDRVMVVVTRWFGGIKLGVGGLVRAYGGCAAECLRTAARAPIVPHATVALALGYAEAELLRARLRDWTAQTLAEDFGADRVAMQIAVPSARLRELEALIADLSRGRCRLRVLARDDAPTA